ncbi:beta-galactosidase [Paenibacillus paeoniae]|uniref:Beta-galactosidase n=2 Tax=Paenibacillus paeoniae TaxID=2292705 RepID=A0A371P6Z7_9BACL|nr:beta-galactosidase [Paenibacillus paeoniae]
MVGSPAGVKSLQDGRTQPLVAYDRHSWIIRGQRVFIRSAAVHYYRLTRGEWVELLDKVKQAGCNTVETYIPWNWHEETPGKWDFSGDKDLEHFLDLCAERGLYAIVRPGPYICAEWDFGGLPWWLSAEEGIQYRTMNDRFLSHVDRYWDEIVPRLARHQITAGGTVIMVQVENEFQAYGKPDQAYMEYLRDGLLARGIDVPLVTCYGGVEGAVEFRNFWSGADTHARILEQRFTDQPKGVMEFWIGWFEKWGGAKASQKSAPQLERACYELLQAGFTAINYYMFFGGTNFDHWGGRTIGEDTYMITSYDYDAPLTEYLEPTPKYKTLQRFHGFVNWLEPVLTEAENCACDIPLSKSLSGRTLHHKDGTLHFMTNLGGERYSGQAIFGDLPVMADYTVEGDGMLPVVTGVAACGTPSGGSIIIDALTGFTTGIHEGRGIIYHELGQRSSLVLNMNGLQEYELDCPLPLQVKRLDGGHLHIRLFHGSEPRTITIRSEGEVLLQLTVTHREAVEAAGVQNMGREFIPSQPELEDWQYAEENPDDYRGEGKSAHAPLDFSTFGKWSGHLLYETKFDADLAGNRTLLLPRLEDPAQVFINSLYVGGTDEIGAAALDVPVQKGSNLLQIWSQNMGRYNFTATLGEPKGLSEAPALDGRRICMLKGWQVDGAGRSHSLLRLPEIEGRIGLFKSWHNEQGYDRAVIVGYGLSRLSLNGRQVPLCLQNDSAWNRDDAPYGVADASELLQAGENRLELDAAGLSSIPKLNLYVYHSSQALGSWTTMPAALPERVREWSAMPALREPSTELEHYPRWWRSGFRWRGSDASQGGCKLKLSLDGMTKGAVWVNGFCIGRYWGIGPQEDYKIPADKLREHNELLIFDELGAAPRQVRLIAW